MMFGKCRDVEEVRNWVECAGVWLMHGAWFDGVLWCEVMRFVDIDVRCVARLRLCMGWQCRCCTRDNWGELSGDGCLSLALDHHRSVGAICEDEGSKGQERRWCGGEGEGAESPGQGHQEAERGGERDEGEEAEGWQEVEGPECAEAAADGFLHLLERVSGGIQEGEPEREGSDSGGKGGRREMEVDVRS